MPEHFLFDAIVKKQAAIFASIGALMKSVAVWRRYTRRGEVIREIEERVTTLEVKVEEIQIVDRASRSKLVADMRRLAAEKLREGK